MSKRKKNRKNRKPRDRTTMPPRKKGDDNAALKGMLVGGLIVIIGVLLFVIL
jgi:hypothetical protein